MGRDDLKTVADTLFDYLRDVIYEPAAASLDPEALPEEFRMFAKGLLYFCESVGEARVLSKNLAAGELDCALPSPENEIAAPLKALHAALKHLAWQARQVASGDFKQRVDFMGGFSESFNDMIAQLKRRSHESANERSRLRRHVDLLLAHYPEFIMMFDRDGRLAFASESCLMIFGEESVSELIGASFDELFAKFYDAEQLSEMRGLFAAAAEEKRTRQTERTIDLSGDGKPRHFQVKLTPVFDASGAGEGIMLSMLDTTEIMNARDLAEKSLQVRADFLARMSHEMRTPMNVIIGMAAIHKSTDSKRRKEYCVEQITAASEQLLGIINDLLDVSMLEDGEYEITNSIFDFAEMTAELFGEAEAKASKRGQRFETDVDARIPRHIISDEARIARVLDHLISNAIKFTPDGGRIFFSAVMADGGADGFTLRFTVKDEGIGISGENLRKLFVPFEQLDGGTTRQHGGAGLGLAICKRVVNKMGGEITVYSNVGEGSSFVIEIPARRGEFAERSGETCDRIFSGKTILLAEDVEMNREIVHALLEHTGVTIDYAEDGLEALEAFKNNPGLYKLIFMDIHMPNLDGYDAAKRIRASGLPGAGTVPIIAMTANVYREDVERCFASGMDGHIGKPIDADTVIAKMKQYIF